MEKSLLTILHLLAIGGRAKQELDVSSVCESRGFAAVKDDSNCYLFGA